MDDAGQVAITEELVIEKFDAVTGRLVERITVRDGVIVARETFEEGN